MKIALSTLPLLVSTAAADLSSLRSSFYQMVSSAATETYDARIVVGGLSGMVSDDEVNYISKQVLTAYNKAFGFDNAGQKLGDVKTRGYATIPADSFWWEPTDKQGEAAFINAQVDVFYYKDGFGSASDFGDLHEKFEQDLCDRLQKSSFSNLAHAKDCSFSFLEHTGLNNEGPVETAYGHGEITEAQLTLVGLANEMTESDNELLNKVVTAAHNEAFANSALSLGLFETLADVHVGDQHEGWLHTCGLCCPYDDDDPRCCCRADDVTVVVARVAAAGPIEQVNYRHAKISHADFQDFVCFKLRNSGSATFEHVHDCTFNFVYNPVRKTPVVVADN
ncbi:hypothetical protein ACA910_010941 [Epithemia clementina (nom. ined.)]